MTSKPRKPRLLSEKEEELWSKVTRTAVPLERAGSDTQQPGARSDSPYAPKVEDRAAEAGALTPPKLAHALKPTVKKAPPLADFEDKALKQLSRGRQAIEARIDLHGMTRSQAHTALLAFLASARADGHRHALVITGKGSEAAEDDDLVAIMTRERGVLRQAVRQWMTLPEFRAHVVSFAEASPRHGGGGALYVRLRRSDR